MALQIYTLTFADRTTAPMARTSVDVFAHGVNQAVVDGCRGFAAMGADMGRWMPARVELRADQDL
jgi:hypothetical protein